MSGSWLSATTSDFFWAGAGSAASKSPRQRVARAVTVRRMSMNAASIVGWLTAGRPRRETADIIHLLRWARKGGGHEREATAAGGAGEHAGGHRAVGGRACPRGGAGALQRRPRRRGRGA